MRITNTISGTREEFSPLAPPNVTMYSCGVTVYDDSHIGHARSLFIFDVMRRYLKFRGFNVRFIRNITDVEDKIIKRSRELSADWRALVDSCLESYRRDLQWLGISPADAEPRATDNIPDMISFIGRLIEKKAAYATRSGVYFSVRAFPGYGKLSGQSVDQMRAGSRIEPDEAKKDLLDFALWKKAKPDEPYWKSPWGEGRPGWHIECSVMSMKYLGVETLDIHAGGRDLIFPHHENEIAQSEALTKKPFARYWVHHGLLTIRGQKMSKSLGNFVTIKNFREKYASPDILKLFFLSVDYGHPIDYTEARIEEARQALDRIMVFLQRTEKSSGGGWEGNAEIETFRQDFVDAMDDDFGMPRALASVFELITATYKRLNEAAFVSAGRALVIDLLSILGISSAASASVAKPGEEEDIRELIAQRTEARKARDFASADRIRRQLEERGIIIEDTGEGTLWRRRI